MTDRLRRGLALASVLLLAGCDGRPRITTCSTFYAGKAIIPLCRTIVGAP